MRRMYSMVKKTVRTYSITVRISLSSSLVVGRVSMKAAMRLNAMATITVMSKVFPAGVSDSATIRYSRGLSLRRFSIVFMLVCMWFALMMYADNIYKYVCVGADSSHCCG